MSWRSRKKKKDIFVEFILSEVQKGLKTFYFKICVLSQCIVY